MLIYVMMKNASRASKKVKEYPFYLEKKPATLRELIEESVESCLSLYQDRVRAGRAPRPLTAEEEEGMREIGKFTFGASDTGKMPERDAALKTALSAYEDGLVRVFIENKEVEGLDSEINIGESSRITFVRLTMLTGTMW